MTTAQINAQLYRPLKSGQQYERFMPDSKCESVYMGKGDTSFAIKEMANWAKKHQKQTQELAKQLIGEDIEETVNNIQDFLYNHIQYRIDEDDQNLKSPACSWATRTTGTDCKSYTIFGSTLLLNLGIKHYLRRIKQAVMPDAYTHVYIVIPVNQRNAKLTEGYYTIDGTIKYNNELSYTEADDIYMEPKLATYGLAAPGMGCGTANCGCGGNKLDFSGGVMIQHPAMAGMFDNINFGNIFGSLSCIGGTLDKRDLEKMQELTADGFDELYSIFNSILEGYTASNAFQLQLSINNILSSSAALYLKATRNAAYDWSSSCSRDAAKGFKEVGKFYNDIAEKAFFQYLSNFFTFTVTSITVRGNDYPFPTEVDGKGMSKNSFQGGEAPAKQLQNLALKPGMEVPFFEVTPYVASSIENNTFSLNNLLGELTDIAIQYAGGGNNNNTNPDGTTDWDNDGIINDVPDAPQQAGFGIGGFLLVAAAAGAVYYTVKTKKANGN